MNGCLRVVCKTVCGVSLIGALCFNPIMAQESGGKGGNNECYKVTRGGENLSCRLFAENLNRQCDIPFSAMACGIRIHPDYAKDFWVPKWEGVPLEVSEDIAWLLMARYDDLCMERGDNAAMGRCIQGGVLLLPRSELQDVYFDKLKSGRYKIEKASVDLDHDGEKEVVYRVKDVECEPRNAEVKEGGGDFDLPSNYYRLVLVGGAELLIFDFQRGLGLFRGNIYIGAEGW